MKRDEIVYLKHIFDSIKRIEEYTKGINHNDFVKGNLIQAGVIRELEIIGEASKKITKEMKDKYAEIPWKKMAGMRDKLIRDYMGVDIEAVWDTVKKDIPELNTRLKNLI